MKISRHITISLRMKVLEFIVGISDFSLYWIRINIYCMCTTDSVPLKGINIYKSGRFQFQNKSSKFSFEFGAKNQSFMSTEDMHLSYYFSHFYYPSYRSLSKFVGCLSIKILPIVFLAFNKKFHYFQSD